MILPRWSMHKQSKFLQVIDEAYSGTKLSSTDQAILSYNGLDKNSGYSVPLEIKPSGQFEPLYKTKLDVQVSSSLVLLQLRQFRSAKWFSCMQLPALVDSIVLCFCLFFFSHGRMGSCQFFHYLFTEQLQWHIVKSRMSTHHHISFSSICMINEM